MDLTEFNAKPGDLIEISRVLYQHWALYIGNMEVVHLTTPGGDVALETTGKVKREMIKKVVGHDRFKVNNLLDEKYPPREPYIIVKEACSMVGQELWYSLTSRNCEHFVTDLRYGKAESRQVTTAAEIGGTVLAVGLAAAAAAVVAYWLKDDNKEERSEERREERRQPRRHPRRHYNWQQ
ncbi:phospholipase A and acyltransferase 4-like isoform X2 [Etheostoma cragini]|uniref:phospholipase A and acyltransferase 4-like isoform X2 n=1 Tax=Etheostoma cragini TaxID=417921 RepID=UPI00155E2987|nr:phospholipase A and acyltransferase 4-like isoform X2 [Etheostoma cragini]